MAEKQRIEWIDTAKGICILLVVLHHTSRFLKIDYPCAADFMVFRMPLYFILSGLFFKSYSGFLDFLQRKVNKLIVPYLFFFTLGGVILPVLLFNLFDFRVWSYKDYGVEALGFVFSEKIICNPSIWFLVCLFEVNIIFYCIQLVSRLSSHRNLTYLLLSIGIGIVGLLLSYFSINLPYYLDSALSATPFFYAGWYMRNHTSFLTFHYDKKTLGLSFLFVLLVIFEIHFIRFGICSIISNYYGGVLGILQLYPYGIMGTLAVLLIAKALGTIPLISYVGRYSIIVLCTHAYVIQFSGLIISEYIHNSILIWIVFIATSLICALIIPFFKKYLPHVTAQKDIFKFNV